MLPEARWPHWAGTTDCPHTTRTATFHLRNLLLYVSSSIKTLNIINVRSLYTLQAHSSSKERVQLQHCPWPALLHSTQDQGSMESPLPALLAAEVLSPPRFPQGTTHLLSFKIQVGGSITEHKSPPSFLGCPQAEPVALQGSHPSLTHATSEIRVLELIRNVCITALPGSMFSPVIQFSFWGLQLGYFFIATFQGEEIELFEMVSHQLITRLSLAVPVWCYHSHKVTTQSMCCRNPGASAAAPVLTPGIPCTASQPTGSIWQQHMLLNLLQRLQKGFRDKERYKEAWLKDR